MRTILILALLTIVFPAYASAQKAQTPAKLNTEQALIKMDRELMDALVKKDKAVADRIELANHVFINPGGGLEEKGKMTGAGPTFESMEPSDQSVRVNGDSAVLTGMAMVKGKLANGTDITGTYRYMRVFVKQKGEWRLAATSAVEIKPATLPAALPKTLYRSIEKASLFNGAFLPSSGMREFKDSNF
jgi:hypothetical protein